MQLEMESVRIAARQRTGPMPLTCAVCLDTYQLDLNVR